MSGVLRCVHTQHVFSAARLRVFFAADQYRWRVDNGFLPTHLFHELDHRLTFLHIATFKTRSLNSPYNRTLQSRLSEVVIRIAFRPSGSQAPKRPLHLINCVLVVSRLHSSTKMLALGNGSQTRSAGVSRLPKTPARRVTRLSIRASRQEGPTGWVTTSNKKVIAVCGFGPGISSAVASLWASKGFDVALLSRTQARLDKAAEGTAILA